MLDSPVDGFKERGIAVRLDTALRIQRGGVVPEPKKPDLQSDAVVEALVSDPSHGPPATTALRGYLGKSSTEGVWRLYLNTGLDEYVEIPESEIQHSETLAGSSGTTIWIANTLALKHVRTQMQHVQAEFLSGAITDELLHATSDLTPTPGLIPMPSITGPCASGGFVCYAAHASHGCSHGCPTFHHPCTSHSCPSTSNICPFPFRSWWMCFGPVDQ